VKADPGVDSKVEASSIPDEDNIDDNDITETSTEASEVIRETEIEESSTEDEE
jgi:hypothetical protein